MAESQIDRLKAAANTPTDIGKPSAEMMDHAVQTSLGNNTGSGRTVRTGSALSNNSMPLLKTVGSWEGYHKTSPAHIVPNGGGYFNPNLHASRRIPKELIAPSTRPTMAKQFSPYTNLDNTIMKPSMKGGSSISKLSKLTKLNRLF